MNITLYHSPGACSMATYISLVEAGSDFDVKLISLKDNEQSSAEYAALNPKKKVPFLLVDNKGLSENVAIQTWISETYPAAKLMPEESWDKKRALSYMAWFGSAIHPHITRHFKPVKFCAHTEAHDDLKTKAKAMYMDQLAILDSELQDRTWFFEHYTVCDSYFFWIYHRATREGFDLSGLEHCTAHFDRMNSRDSVQRVLEHTGD